MLVFYSVVNMFLFFEEISFIFIVISRSRKKCKKKSFYINLLCFTSNKKRRHSFVRKQRLFFLSILSFENKFILSFTDMKLFYFTRDLEITYLEYLLISYMNKLMSEKKRIVSNNYFFLEKTHDTLTIY